ncbi:hypothetical protein SLEP1_g56275 [Rubroshorea leprosula]|uniref:Reverse transcriptase Ty1/copia-type domain-containing protein n=1 Tax=Rubroshorea leprosula TaxID=152421 RepID=A0AAV5MJ59_9ROSI|nr:hypothetical protein SLEP1_g56275 [Rubroshorea leprosula]
MPSSRQTIHDSFSSPVQLSSSWFPTPSTPCILQPPLPCTSSASTSAPSTSYVLESSPVVHRHLMVTRSQDGTHRVRTLPSLLSTAVPVQEPKSFSHVVCSPKWCKAMVEEYSAFLSNDTWELVPCPCPSNANIVGSKWVYKIKQKFDGTIERHKARLVAQGYIQQPSIDYDDTFSPVVKLITIRTILTLRASCSWPVHQLDVKNAFLNGELTQPVYMHQPPGFIDSARLDYVCRLWKAFYGLKQAPRACQSKYILELLERAGMKDCQVVAIPLDSKKKLAATDSPPYFNPSGYRSIVGALQYANFTHSDIAFVAQQVCQYMHASIVLHFQAVKRILRYLKGTLHYGLQLRKTQNFSLHVFINID